MINQKYIPEGWNSNVDEVDVNSVKRVFEEGKVLQGYVNECDSNYNLHIKLGNGITGILPRNELEIINTDEYGFCNPSICKNKVNNFVQFKVKEVYKTDTIHKIDSIPKIVSVNKIVEVNKLYSW